MSDAIFRHGMMPSAEEIRKEFQYDATVGSLVWRRRVGGANSFYGKPAGWLDHGYRYVGFESR